MIFSLKIKRKRRPNRTWKEKLETISMKMIKSGKMQSTQVARERKKVAGTLPTNCGYRPFPNCYVSMNIIFTKNL